MRQSPDPARRVAWLAFGPVRRCGPAVAGLVAAVVRQIPLLGSAFVVWPSDAGSANRMLNAYNAGFRQYAVDNHCMDTLAFHAISGAAIIDKFGYKECPRK
jgi:hypothetical protein